MLSALGLARDLMVSRATTLAYTCDPPVECEQHLQGLQKGVTITRLLGRYRLCPASGWPLSSHLEDPQASIQRMS